MASADKPFRFPATFTFVVRSFTVLDGIGKSLNPKFDISEIAAPYARGLLLEARPQFAQLTKNFRKRAATQVPALSPHSFPPLDSIQHYDKRTVMSTPDCHCISRPPE